MVSISYCVTACNEHKELDKLLFVLLEKMKSEDEIVLQVDSDNVTVEVIDVINKHMLEASNSSKIRLIAFPLNKDFSSFKNNAYKECSKDYIFQIDADEYPSETLIDNIHDILELNPTVELFLIPRINTVSGLTEAHIQKWGWRLDENGWVNYPDYQTRISKNTPEIHFVGKVHERLIKANNSALINDFLPTHHDLDLIHEKDIDRQERQNYFYQNI
jgi:glycosyltransferase involved in cell wall biosynthesis